MKRSKFAELRPNPVMELRQLRDDLATEKQLVEQYRSSLSLAERQLLYCSQNAEAQDAEIRRLLRTLGQVEGK